MLFTSACASTPKTEGGGAPVAERVRITNQAYFDVAACRSDLETLPQPLNEGIVVGAVRAAQPQVMECLVDPKNRAGAESTFAVQHDLLGTMQELVGIVRREEEMEQALAAIAALKERAGRAGVPGNREYNPGWHTAVDLAHLVTVSEAITRAALERKESRGGHFRDDHPEKDPAYATFNVLVRRGADGEMTISREPIPPLPPELQQIIQENA